MTRKILSAALALGLTLSAAAALAQDPAYPTQDPAADPAAQTTDPAAQTTDPAAQTTDPAAQPTDPAAQDNQVTWADLDADGDGNLSKDEASSVASLAQSFDQIDTDGDGFISQEDYKAFVAQNQGEAAQPDDEG